MKQTQAHAYIVEKAKNTPPLLAFSESGDVPSWRAAAKAKLFELLGLPLERCADEFTVLSERDTEIAHQITFSFQSEEGYFIEGEFLVPLGVTEKRPVVICLQGHTTGKHVSLGIQKYPSDASAGEKGQTFAVQAVEQGFCAVAIDQRYMGESGHNSEGLPGCCTTGHALPALLLGRTAIGERVWDAMRLIDVLEAYFTAYIDTDRILCLGNSGGGTATFYTACLDERIYLAVPSCGVCTYEASIIEIHHCACNYVPGIRRYFNMGDLGCLIAPRRLVVVCGTKDDIFPVAGVEETYAVIRKGYRAAGKEPLCRLVKGDGGHRFYPADAWPVIRELMETT